MSDVAIKNLKQNLAGYRISLVNERNELKEAQAIAKAVRTRIDELERLIDGTEEAIRVLEEHYT